MREVRLYNSLTNKKEEFNYYSLKAIEAEKNGDRKSYLVYLKIASEILKQIEEEEKKTSN